MSRICEGRQGMKLSIALCLLGSAFASPLLQKRTDGSAITSAQYANLVRYTKFASAAYANDCASPNGATLVEMFADAQTDTQGYVARDDAAKEIILALRGSSSVQDIVSDVMSALVPCNSTNVPYPAGALCHTGFQTSYNAVEATVLSTVAGQLAAHPSYKITVTGHSLGGGLSSIASLSMAYSFPGSVVTGYSFGQPRTGNTVYADFHDATFPFVNGEPTFLRGIHTKDGVPQVIRQGSDGSFLVSAAGLLVLPNDPNATTGYRHHATEFWQTPDPSSQANTVQCRGQEDPTCQNSVYIFAPLLGINADHLTYFGVSIGNPVSTSGQC